MEARGSSVKETEDLRGFLEEEEEVLLLEEEEEEEEVVEWEVVVEEVEAVERVDLREVEGVVVAEDEEGIFGEVRCVKRVWWWWLLALRW